MCERPVNVDRESPMLLPADLREWVLGSGEAAQGDPEVLVGAYLSFVQGLALLVCQETGMEKKITAEILTSVLRAEQ